MIKRNERRLEELIRKMGLQKASEYEREDTPIHLGLYISSRTWVPEFLLAQIMILDTNEWSALGYSETDRVSVIRHLGDLKCRTDGALSVAARFQQPLTSSLAKILVDAGTCDKGALSMAAIYQKPLSLDLVRLLIDAEAYDKSVMTWAAGCQHPLPLELAKLLIDAGAFDKGALSHAANRQRPLTLELAKLLMDAGCGPAVQDGDDLLVNLAVGGNPVDPQVTDLFLSAGCRANLSECKSVSDETRLRFDQILKEHAEWKEKQAHLIAENSPADFPVDWDR